MLLPNHLFFTSLSFASKAFKIHSFLSLSINIILSNPVLRGHQQNSAHDSGRRVSVILDGYMGEVTANYSSEYSTPGIKWLNAAYPIMSGVLVL